MSDKQVPNRLTPQGPVDKDGLLVQPASDEALKDFNNRVWSTWNRLMQQFFEQCESEARTAGLSGEDVNRALWRGYGSDVADEWAEWIKQED